MTLMNKPCRICGKMKYADVTVSNDAGFLTVNYPSKRDTGRKGPFGGAVMRKSFSIHSKVCEYCGNVTLFSSYKSRS